MNLLFIGVIFDVCVGVGYVHPNSAKVGCVLMVFCMLLMLHYELIKNALF